MIVVGLTGHKRSGKNSVADILTKDFGFEQLSFAAALKDILREQDPILGYGKFASGPRHEVHLSELIDAGWDEDDIKSSDFGGEYRRLLEKLGTEGIRKYDDSFWINLIAKKILLSAGTDKRYVITDCRFPNEAKALRHGTALKDTVEIWEVRRPGTTPTGELHASEKHVGHMDEDFAIYNDHDLAHLRQEVTNSAATLVEDATARKDRFDTN